MKKYDTNSTRRGLFGGVLLMASLAVLAGTEAVTADVLYDTFGPGDSYNSQSGWINGHHAGGEFSAWNAMSFDVGPGSFTDIHITVPLTYQNVVGNPEFFFFQLKIYASDGTAFDPNDNPVSNTPGTLLKTLNLSAGADLPERLGDGPYPLSTFEFEDIVLSGDTRYWLALETEVPADGRINWHVNDIGLSGWKAQKDWNDGSSPPANWTMLQPGSWGNDGAMRVTGMTVPAPGAAAALIAGLIGFSKRRRR